MASGFSAQEDCVTYLQVNVTNSRKVILFATAQPQIPLRQLGIWKEVHLQNQSPNSDEMLALLLRGIFLKDKIAVFLQYNKASKTDLCFSNSRGE